MQISTKQVIYWVSKIARLKANFTAKRVPAPSRCRDAVKVIAIALLVLSFRQDIRSQNFNSIGKGRTSSTYMELHFFKVE